MYPNVSDTAAPIPTPAWAGETHKTQAKIQDAFIKHRFDCVLRPLVFVVAECALTGIVLTSDKLLEGVGFMDLVGGIGIEGQPDERVSKLVVGDRSESLS